MESSNVRRLRLLSPLSAARREEGVSILELAIMLPLLFGLIAGMVEFGLKINTIKQLSHAARHSARIAASHARRVQLNKELVPYCSEPADSSAAVESLCPADVSGLAVKMSDSVAAAAYKSACATLASSRLNPPDWRVRTSVQTDARENLHGFKVINVTITKVRDECMICYNKLNRMFEAQASSGFVLEAQCE